jgi:hypothetical protein
VETPRIIQKREGNFLENPEKKEGKRNPREPLFPPFFSSWSSRQIKKALFQDEHRISKPHYCRKNLVLLIVQQSR